MGIIHPTTTANIGFGFGSTSFASYEDRTWHGNFYANFHGGIDYWGPLNYPIWACANGTVLYAGFAVPYIGSAGGNGVVIAHGPNMKSIYGHMNSISVAPGQQVVAGQNIGAMGQSGIANGVIHLHFEVRTITAAWGEDVEDPNALMTGGSLETSFGIESYDIPWIEPPAGQTVRMGLCVRQGDGSYALPTAASSVNAVYYDRLRTSAYTTRTSGGTVYIVPNSSLSSTVEVRADYVT